MALLIGVGLALTVSLFAFVAGFDRDRAFYPTVVLVVASYYILFAVMSGSTQALLLESLVMMLFMAGAVLGFRISLWFAVAGLAGHGLFDFVHFRLIVNPGVPPWWPLFCGSYDVMAAACLGWLLLRDGARARRDLGLIGQSADNA